MVIVSEKISIGFAQNLTIILFMKISEMQKYCINIQHFHAGA